jgi:ribonuclease-3
VARRRDSSQDLDEFFEHLSLKPKDSSIYVLALTHRSTLNEAGAGLVSYERLEFLGDSVLGHAVAEYLYREYPDLNEGQLARRKSALVSEASLAAWASHLELGKHLILGKGEEQTGGRQKVALLADVFEAVLGAIYLDLGWEIAKKFVERSLESVPLSRSVQKTQDAKSRLQEYTQRLYKKPPQYHLLESKGPDHAKVFAIEVLVGGKRIASGKGKTKKEAEQEGATQALEALEQT